MALLGLHISLAALILQVHTLYVGGDSMRDAWSAWKFLQSRRIPRDLTAPYESGLFALCYVPFTLAFGNTIGALKAAALTFTSATVIVFYAFLYRAYGLTAALCLGAVFATSPQLLAHSAWGSLYIVIFWTALTLLLDTLPGTPALIIRWTLAGIFASFNGYFLFPLLVYGLWRGIPIFPCARKFRESASEKLAALGFFAGLLPLVYRMAASGPGIDTLSWLSDLWATNSNHLIRPWRSLTVLWTQWSYSLDSFKCYGQVPGPAHISDVTLGWLVLIVAGLIWRESRRLALALLSGMVAVGLIQSVHGGLGMRHLLAFLPFQWLLLAPMIASFRKRALRLVVVSLSVVLTLRQLVFLFSFLHFADHTAGLAVLRGVQELAQRLTQPPLMSASVAGSNPNVYLTVLFLAADRPPIQVDSEGHLPANRGIILLSKPPPAYTWDELTARSSPPVSVIRSAGGSYDEIRYEKGLKS